MLSKARGFIGPIGDDLPSLIPLLFGLVMFFAAFTSTFNAFDKRNTEFNDEIAVMRVSRVLQSTSYIYSYDDFQSLCSQVGVVNVKYVAGISNQATDDKLAPSGRPDSIFGVKFFQDSAHNPFYCSNVAPSGSPSGVSDFLGLKDALNYKVTSRIFPLVVEDDKVVKPMHLYVIAWK